ncbi:immunoglobulin superfamily member 23 [Choloepus didactylus]|uniref:immunoglobulin superfamily member 23 n=1 Tax=Choloepus didactylus TaxID=27675 RepID=UPI0018A11ED4|nr:immunoglobulin superfamily member 23 [Choloepus didactylus]
MTCPLDAGPSYGPAWKRLLLAVSGRRRLGHGLEARRHPWGESLSKSKSPPLRDRTLVKVHVAQEANAGGLWKALEGTSRLGAHLLSVLPALPSRLLQGTLLTSCTCSVSLELPVSAQMDPWTKGTRAHLNTPGSLHGILTTSRFWGHKAQPEAMIFSPEGPPGPGHTGQEIPGSRDSLGIKNLMTQDSGSYTVVPESIRGRRSAKEQLQSKAAPGSVLLITHLETIQDVIQSELNYSVVLRCLANGDPEPTLSWTLDGKLYDTGERLIIRRLSWQQLGTYVCTAKNSEGQLSSQPVTVSLAQANAEPTEALPFKQDPTLTLSGGAAIGLAIAGTVGAVMLIGGVRFTIIQSRRH